MNALIGYTGFVGQTLMKQTSFDELYRSTNIEEIIGKEFDTIVCAGAPAVKWLANKEPDNDKRIIENLIDILKTVKCNKFILISTVDVFKDSYEADEDSLIEESDLQPYGLHRRLLEKFITNNFTNSLIVRLPGLVGPGLKKNIIFDFLNENNIDQVDSRGIFQFYPMVNLWSDIKIALKENLNIIHLTSEPLSVKDIAENAYNIKFKNEILKIVPKYNLITKHSSLYSSTSKYQYSKKEVITVIRAYAQSEMKKEL
ncbi:NAD-dependent epimerase/dehydratase family protein [Photobacterium leiognathi]|uniref:NAD-dependent epimerase/dehydratase family protein n=1 Tax=Photobacterium leiognathi TaxID=553611 RepID=UPI002981AA98|nr:NAD-dependent epimerase/dehydratase family protein [Photobacterium leiognathi]